MTVKFLLGQYSNSTDSLYLNDNINEDYLLKAVDMIVNYINTKIRYALFRIEEIEEHKKILNDSQEVFLWKEKSQHLH